MKIFVTENYEAMSKKAASIIGSYVTLHPDCVLGLATGSTPIGMYKELYTACQKGELDFSQVKTVNLDEYVGLDPKHDQSYRYFMQKNFFDHLNIDPKNTNVPNGLAEDPAAECARYDSVIDNYGGIDLQLLGIGHNGHIGFNEPADSFPVGTNCVTLQARTIEANSRFFASADEVPKKAFTMGIRAIMNARRILVIVNGADKADIVKAAVTGPVTPAVPVSILQLHPNVTLVGDKAAMSKL